MYPYSQPFGQEMKLDHRPSHINCNRLKRRYHWICFISQMSEFISDSLVLLRLLQQQPVRYGPKAHGFHGLGQRASIPPKEREPNPLHHKSPKLQTKTHKVLILCGPRRKSFVLLANIYLFMEIYGLSAEIKPQPRALIVYTWNRTKQMHEQYVFCVVLCCVCLLDSLDGHRSLDVSTWVKRFFLCLFWSQY